MPVYIPGGVSVIPIIAVDGLAESLDNIISTPSISEGNASRVASLSDIGRYIRFTSATSQTYTINTSVVWPEYCEIHGRNAGTGELLIAAASGVTINLPYLGTLRIPTGGTFTLKHVAANEWDLFGQTVPV